MASVPVSANRPVRLVRSSTNPATFYRVGPESCECPAFYFRRHRDPLYRCRHMEEAWPFLCIACGQSPAAPRRLECFGCINARRDVAREARLVALLSEVEWPE